VKRREFLLACSAIPLLLSGYAQGAEEFLDQVPDYQRFPTLKELESWLDRFEAELIGHSPQGRPLKLLRLNPGKRRKALFLGGVHANEPHGLPAIQFLAETLSKPGNLLMERFPNVTFLLVPVVDPDGLALNDGFFQQERTVENYLLNYYRPKLWDTAIYTFPFQGSVSTPTSGCKALMSVIEKERPILVDELHGCEFGSAIYASETSAVDSIERLIHQFYPLPSNHASPLHQMLTLKQKQAAGRKPRGGSTLDFARQFQTAAETLNLELGLWHNPILYDESNTRVTKREAELFYREACQAGLEIYRELKPLLRSEVTIEPPSNAMLYLDAFRVGNFEKLPEVSKSTGVLSGQELFRTVGGPLILHLRNYALLMGLARELGHPDAEDACRDYIRKYWRASEQQFLKPSHPAPIRSIVQCLVGAALTQLE
jgi:hypothetical protein